ncbi:pyridoxamine 5'-phosphate oxidase family protein [Plesiomonas sp.]|uniref:pyridoxamine 5'-phosphate oxidase family protein n=1 Tax=Plesiomonas sp. TaxID=2486279 RepID=UPI003F380EDD
MKRMREKRHEGEIAPDSRFGHEGELAMRDKFPSPIYRWDEQTLSGMIQRSISLGMARFIEAQQFFFVATADNKGHCDAGFRSSTRSSTLGKFLPSCIVVDGGRSLLFPVYDNDSQTSMLHNIEVNPHIGMIFIDFTRIGRVRVNGLAYIEKANKEITNIWPEARTCVHVVVEQAYGNCPARIPHLVPASIDTPQQADDLSVNNLFLSKSNLTQCKIPLEIKTFIEAQPFFFIATADDQGHCDASFRGSEPHYETGKMQPSCQIIDNGQVLIFPDYSGNAIYNSLGNIVMNPNIGMVFIDFSHSRGVMISGSVSIEEVNQDIKRIWPRAQSYLRVVVKKIDSNCLARIPKLTTV